MLHDLFGDRDIESLLGRSNSSRVILDHPEHSICLVVVQLDFVLATWHHVALHGQAVALVIDDAHLDERTASRLVARLFVEVLNLIHPQSLVVGSDAVGVRTPRTLMQTRAGNS